MRATRGLEHPFPLLAGGAFTLLTCVPLSSCGDTQADVQVQFDEVARVRCYRDGHVTLNGSPVSLEGLSVSFASLSQRGGAVWYYREDATSKAHPNASAVIQAVLDARLPISMSSEEDFSNVVFPDGTIKPREDQSNP